MSILIQDQHDTEHDVFAAWQGGRLLLVVRADTREDGIAAAVGEGLLIMYEAEEGVFVPRAAPDVDVSEIGPMAIEPAVYGEDGETVVTPAVMDDRHHTNFQLGPKALERVDPETGELAYKQTLIRWTRDGTDATELNAGEVAKRLANVELIDPASITTLLRNW
ncbi:hypothetical protein [Citreimonas sp.]|uniref:hypothetical protein n=1 Tax=Citreimonas sp. TaxID=3036715 RepID=UPI0040580AC5